MRAVGNDLASAHTVILVTRPGYGATPLRTAGLSRNKRSHIGHFLTLAGSLKQPLSALARARRRASDSRPRNLAQLEARAVWPTGGTSRAHTRHVGDEHPRCRPDLADR